MKGSSQMRKDFSRFAMQVYSVVYNTFKNHKLEA